MNFMKLIEKWFPSAPRDGLSEKLAAFYRTRTDYHEMIGRPGKDGDPQVALLESLLSKEKAYLEVGCGGGAVCRKVARYADITGVDVSRIALNNARAAGPGRIVYLESAADELPVASESVDGVYSFEVLEHLWNPMAAVREMIRVVRPGGFILLSMPNRFSLDLHLVKSWRGRLAELVMASMRFLRDQIMREPFVTFTPDLDGDIHPDCDAVSSVIPRFFCDAACRAGAELVFWDSGYMCAHRRGSSTTLGFQRRLSRPFARNYGDHFLILFRKRPKDK